MAQHNARLFTFSGTGNTLRVARWMAAAIENDGGNAEIVPLRGGMHSDELASAREEIVGFLTPTHGFTAPWLAIKIAARMPRGNGRSAFVIATRAGTKFGPLFLPGIAGSAPFLLSLILRFRGYRVRGAAALDMASNWMSLHSGFNKRNVQAINERSRPKAESFIREIAIGKPRWFIPNLLYEAFWGVVLSVISVLYLLFGRIMLAKAFFADERCNSCGKCAKHCPVNGIRLVGKRKPRPYWCWTCESCMRCMAWCPTAAVQASHQAILFFVWLTLFPPTALLTVPLLRTAPVFEAVPTDILYYSAFVLIAYSVAFALGWILHGASRVPIFAKLLSFTTGTRYYRRYHESETRQDDFDKRD